MIISSTRKIIFIHNQKTAGTSIAARLVSAIPDCRLLLPLHAQAADGISKIGKSDWDSYYSFGFVRNPWARLVSWYSMISERPADKNRNSLWEYVRNNSTNFEEFITNCTDVICDKLRGGYIYKKGFAINQLDYFVDENGDVSTSFIGKFENLHRDFEHVSHKLGIEYRKLEIRNRTNDKEYRSYYNKDTKKIVADRFHKDIEYFKYTFDN